MVSSFCTLWTEFFEFSFPTARHFGVFQYFPIFYGSDRSYKLEDSKYFWFFNFRSAVSPISCTPCRNFFFLVFWLLRHSIAFGIFCSFPGHTLEYIPLEWLVMTSLRSFTVTGLPQVMPPQECRLGESLLSPGYLDSPLSLSFSLCEMWRGLKNSTATRCTARSI